jgi:hypothetical protein
LRSSLALREASYPSISIRHPSRLHAGVPRQSGLDNITFHQVDISTFMYSEHYNAIVGRLVLEFAPDPAAVTRRLSGLLRSCGIMAFQKPSWKIWLAYTACLPLLMAATTILRDVFVAGDANTEMELPLFQAFTAAYLTHRASMRSWTPSDRSRPS